MDLAHTYLALLIVVTGALGGMYVQMRRVVGRLDALVEAWRASGMSAMLPEDQDPGEDGGDGTGTPEASYGCTNAGLPDCNCLRLLGPNHSLHIDAIITIAKDVTGDHTGTWQSWIKRPGDPNFHLFTRSVSVTLTNGDHSWKWCHKVDGVCQGWDFPDGTIIEGGFKLSSGTWFDSGPAALTVST